MAKPILNEESKLILKNLITDDYQHGEHYSGEPISIKLSETPDLFSLIFFFENTDEDIAEDWVSDYLKANGFAIDNYEMYGEGDEHSIIAACFSLTAAGADQDYEFTAEELASISPSKQVQKTVNVETNLPANSQASIIANNINALKGTTKKAFKKTTTKTVLPATAASKQIIANLGGSGQSLKGQSNRVSTLDANGNKVSAAKQIQAFIDQVIPILNANDMAILTDISQCKKLASLGFPLFMEVNPQMDYKTQSQFHGKYRYGKKITNILGTDYYTTNHLFQRNIERVKQMFIGMGLLGEDGLANPERVAALQNASNISNSTSTINELNNFQSEDTKSQDIKSNDIEFENTASDNIKAEEIKDTESANTSTINETNVYQQSDELVQATKQVTKDVVNSIENNWNLDSSSNNSENEDKSESINVDIDINSNESDSFEDDIEDSFKGEVN